MTLHILPDLEQGSDEWHDQRRGIVTASVVGRLVSTRTLTATDYQCPECDALAYTACIGKRGAPIKSQHSERAAFARKENRVELAASNADDARNLTLLLAAERITGWTDPTYVTDDMLRGQDDEPRALNVYTEHFAPVERVGFMRRDEPGWSLGYSPDALVGEIGCVEVKSRRAKTQLATFLDDEVPAANMAQLQAGLLVSGREWCDYISFCGGMALYRKRIFPQQQWFDAITAAVTEFETTAAEMVATYKSRAEGLPLTERVIEMEMYL